jgi:hypothetical protein
MEQIVKWFERTTSSNGKDLSRGNNNKPSGILAAVSYD